MCGGEFLLNRVEVMEISTGEEEADPPILVDSGTDSPVAEEDSEHSETFAPSPCQSEDSTILCDIDSDSSKERAKILKLHNLLDKAISVDEESLVTPLEPVKCFLNSAELLVTIAQSEFSESVDDDTLTNSEELVPEYVDVDKTNSINNNLVVSERTNGCDSIMSQESVEHQSQYFNHLETMKEVAGICPSVEIICSEEEQETSNSDAVFDGETDEILVVIKSESRSVETSETQSSEIQIESEVHSTEIQLSETQSSETQLSISLDIQVNKCDDSLGHCNGCTESAQEIIPLSSILRRTSIFDEEIVCSFQSFRRVSFPTNESALVSYREPERNHWNIELSLSAQEILKVYQDSCKVNHSVEMDTIKKQILEIKNNQNRSGTLVLSNITVTRDVCETFEDIFKITNFKSVTIEECKFKDDTLVELMNILEYYETTTEIILAMNIEDVETWKFFTELVSKSIHLESVTCKGLNLAENYTRMLIGAVKNNWNITILRFEKCKLVFTPTFYLVDMLMQYQGLRELYLTETGLQNKEMETVCRYLTNNSYLQVLDISNNKIGDRGLIQLTTGLMTQKDYGPGLSVLIMVNNSITVKSGPVLGNLILCSRNLHTLNIGYNALDDQTILDIQESLINTKKLEGLGLQSTLISCVGAAALAVAIESNTSLKKINLRGNKGIKTEGLEHLSKALTNSKVIKLELDDTNRNCNDQVRYKELVKKINEICAINKSIAEQASSTCSDEVTTLSQLISRKVSLSCSPSFIPTPLPVPLEAPKRKVPSPHPSSRNRSGRNRFQVSKVPDTPSKPPPSPSRFQVFAVSSPNASFSSSSSLNSPPQELEDEVRPFQNVRSSVSSIDSLDSVSPVRHGNNSSVSSIDEILAETTQEERVDEDLIS